MELKHFLYFFHLSGHLYLSWKKDLLGEKDKLSFIRYIKYFIKIHFNRANDFTDNTTYICLLLREGRGSKFMMVCVVYEEY